MTKRTYVEVEHKASLGDTLVGAIGALATLRQEIEDWYLGMQNTPLMHTRRSKLLGELLLRWPRGWTMLPLPPSVTTVEVTCSQQALAVERAWDMNMPNRAVRLSNACRKLRATQAALLQYEQANYAKPTDSWHIRVTIGQILGDVEGVEIPGFYWKPPKGTKQ
jgi:hypothetical protein